MSVTFTYSQMHITREFNAHSDSNSFSTFTPCDKVVITWGAQDRKHPDTHPTALPLSPSVAIDLCNMHMACVWMCYGQELRHWTLSGLTEQINLLPYSKHNKANLKLLNSLAYTILHNEDTSNNARKDNIHMQYLTKLCKYNCRLNVVLYCSCSLMEFSWRSGFD